MRVAPMFVMAALTAALSVPAVAQHFHADHQAPSAPQAPAAPGKPVPDDPAFPPSATSAKARLDQSPRHIEWVDVKVAGSETPVKTFVVYPERRSSHPLATPG
jgi:hypothetical protein